MEDLNLDPNTKLPSTAFKNTADTYIWVRCDKCQQIFIAPEGEIPRCCNSWMKEVKDEHRKHDFKSVNNKQL